MDITPEESARLAELRVALEQEFRENSELNRNNRRQALNDILDLKADFLNTLRHVVKHAQNDGLRAKVAMWGYDKLLEEGKTDVDPLAELLKGLPTSTSTSQHATPSNS